MGWRQRYELIGVPCHCPRDSLPGYNQRKFRTGTEIANSVREIAFSCHLCDGHLILEVLSLGVDTLLLVVDNILRANLQQDILLGWNSVVVNKSIKV